MDAKCMDASRCRILISKPLNMQFCWRPGLGHWTALARAGVRRGREGEAPGGYWGGCRFEEDAKRLELVSHEDAKTLASADDCEGFLGVPLQAPWAQPNSASADAVLRRQMQDVSKVTGIPEHAAYRLLGDLLSVMPDLKIATGIRCNNKHEVRLGGLSIFIECQG